MIVFGYTSDLDVLLTYNEDEFNKLVDTYVKGDIYRDGDENITDLESFSRIIAYYMANGLGGEADITDYKVVEYLLEHFEHKFFPWRNRSTGSCRNGFCRNAADRSHFR